MFGIGRRDLAVGLGVAGLVGVPAVAVAVVAVAQVAVWARSGVLVFLAVVAAVLAVAALVTTGVDAGLVGFVLSYALSTTGSLVRVVFQFGCAPFVDWALRTGW